MKLLSLAFLVMASTAVAQENNASCTEIEMVMTTVLTNVSGNPDNTGCIGVFESTVVQAYEKALPNAKFQIEDVTDTTITNVPSALGFGLMGGTYIYTSDSRCMRCKKNAVLSLGDTTFVAELKEMLDRSSCSAYRTIDKVTVGFEPVTSVQQVVQKKPMLREQEYKLKMTTVLDGVSGDPDNKPCIEIFEESVVTAYAGASSEANAQIAKVYDTTVKYGDAAKTNHLRSEAMGTFSFISSADNSCRDCLSGFLNIEDHLQAIGTQKVFEATLKKLLVDSTCAAFSTLNYVSVVYEPRDPAASHEIVLQGALMDRA